MTEDRLASEPDELPIRATGLTKVYRDRPAVNGIDLAEVQELCSRVTIISAGRITYEGSLEELRDRAGRRYRLQVSARGEGVRVCAEIKGISRMEVENEEISFVIDDDAVLSALTRHLADAGLTIRSLIPEQLTLERVFFELTESSELSARMST